MALSALAEYINVDKGALLAPLSVFGSAIIAGVFASITIHTNRKNARMKNSMDFINGHSDKDIEDAIGEVLKLSSKSRAYIEEIATGTAGNEYLHIRTVLNYYESMAICIRRGIYDDKIIKDAIYTCLTDVWEVCSPYVIERRKQKRNKTFFQEVELLCEKWKKKPLKQKHKQK